MKIKAKMDRYGHGGWGQTTPWYDREGYQYNLKIVNNKQVFIKFTYSAKKDIIGHEQWYDSTDEKETIRELYIVSENKDKEHYIAKGYSNWSCGYYE